MKKLIILVTLISLINGCTTTNLPPQHAPISGQTTATYLQASYSISYEISEDKESAHITLSCSPDSSLDLINIQYAQAQGRGNTLQLFVFVLVTTTHATSPGKFYYLDEIPVTGKFVSSYSDSGNKCLFTSRKLSLYTKGTVVLDDKFKEQLKLLNDAPEAFASE